MVARLALIMIFSTACTAYDEPTNAANLYERCESASQSLEACTGEAPSGFIDHCASSENSSAETFAIVDEIAAAECPSSGGKADGLGEFAFRNLCAPFVGAAALVTRARNRDPETLAIDDVAQLRSYVGDSIDDVVFYFEANLIDEWDLGFTDVAFGFDVAAQTFGNRIYFEDPYVPGDAWQLETLAHELRHAEQVRISGGFYPGFALAYCAAFYRSGYDYQSNALEVDARKYASDFSNRDRL